MAGDLITGVLLVDGKESRRGNLRTDGEQIAQVIAGDLSNDDVADLGERHECRVIEGRGRWLVPGGIDPHVHFALPVAGTVTVDDFASGTRSALAGGTTSIIDFVTPARDEALSKAYAARLEEASQAVCDYGLHASLTSWQADTRDELEACVRQYGARSLKLYLAYLETIGLGGHSLKAAMDAAATLDLTVLMHCEDGARISQRQQALLAAGQTGPSAHPRSRLAADEIRAVEQALDNAREAGCRPYIVHVSTSGATRAITAARTRGQIVLAETCPQYLLLDESIYAGQYAEAAAAVMSPPLRSVFEVEALRQALAENVFDVVATDHCAFSTAQKALGRHDFTRIPGGAAGVEHRLALLYSLIMGDDHGDPSAWVRLVSQRPAQIFGLYPRKGSLEVAADADLVLWDPATETAISAQRDHQQCDHSLYEGRTVRGRAERVWLRGRQVVEDGLVTADAGSGRYLWR